jgi:multicomponent Na+:H+ antiporter subunit E
MTQYAAWRTSGILIRMAILTGLWWLLVQGRSDAWLIGLPAVVLAALASLRLGGRTLPRLSLAGLLGFLALFLRESVAGGLDVARRTLHPRLRIQPGFRKYRLRIDDPMARVLLVNCIGLVPGTLAVDLKGDHAELHLLDACENPEPGLLRLEKAIARLFGLTLELNDG